MIPAHRREMPPATRSGVARTIAGIGQLPACWTKVNCTGKLTAGKMSRKLPEKTGKNCGFPTCRHPNLPNRRHGQCQQSPCPLPLYLACDPKNRYTKKNTDLHYSPAPYPPVNASGIEQPTAGDGQVLEGLHAAALDHPLGVHGANPHGHQHRDVVDLVGSIPGQET